MLNPIQHNTRGMDCAMLKREYGGRLAFWGGIGHQLCAPQGQHRRCPGRSQRAHPDISARGRLCAEPHYTMSSQMCRRKTCWPCLPPAVNTVAIPFEIRRTKMTIDEQLIELEPFLIDCQAQHPCPSGAGFQRNQDIWHRTSGFGGMRRRNQRQHSPYRHHWFDQGRTNRTCNRLEA